MHSRSMVGIQISENATPNFQTIQYQIFQHVPKLDEYVDRAARKQEEAEEQVELLHTSSFAPECQ
jgi:hypothetical protein